MSHRKRGGDGGVGGGQGGGGECGGDRGRDTDTDTDTDMEVGGSREGDVGGLGWGSRSEGGGREMLALFVATWKTWVLDDEALLGAGGGECHALGGEGDRARCIL
jgi:hypothetical protein